MPFSTGIANTPSELMTAINSLVTANGWTKIQGETDLQGASPKAARYWRFLFIENHDENWSYKSIDGFRFSETIGGPPISGTWTSSGVATGVVPAPWRTSQISDKWFYMILDCGSPTVVRECEFTCNDEREAPRDFRIQWSNDGLTWTTMYYENFLNWFDGETKTFQFDDGYLNPDFDSPSQVRRAGFDARGNVSTFKGNDTFSHYCDDRFTWQAPGYDANRRVYVMARGHSKLEDSSNYIQFNVSPSYDTSILDFYGQVGSSDDDVIHIFDINPVEYWLYVNSTRLIIITKSGADDYTSTYIGFLGAFADPDNYPSPLFMSSTSDGYYFYTTSNNRLSSMADPGQGAARLRLWDNSWINVINREDSSANNGYTDDAFTYIWPYHCGGTDRKNWPGCWIGDPDDFITHFLNQQDPTAQGDLPMYPCVVINRNDGNIGALQGVYCVPGGTLVPEQAFSSGGVDYRAFPNRNRRDGCNWFVVRED